MDDLEITRRCAEASGWKLTWSDKFRYWHALDPSGKEYVVCEKWAKHDAYSGAKLPDPTANDALEECGYNPLTDDAQAMALVKAMKVECFYFPDGWHNEEAIGEWQTTIRDEEGEILQQESNPDLNRAICLAVAQRGKE